MTLLRYILCGAFLLTAEAGWSQSATPLRRAHAHNDYEHDRPFFDALDQGFCSVEADIFLVDDELLIAHDVSQLSPDRTLKRLYLDPLRKLTREHGGRVFPKGSLFTLLIDIKSDGEKTYAVLDQMLESYGDMLCSTVDGKSTRRGVQVVISGNRPKEMIEADRSRFAGIDGRLSDLTSQTTDDLMPMISDRWPSHFRWRGEGPIPDAEQMKLAKIV
ncbi:MAG: phosphatidylinositol-specific phospholipase C/glycerophosphodiester phosphodiesterase family protein, partial [Planctomycetota bacterium]